MRRRASASGLGILVLCAIASCSFSIDPAARVPHPPQKVDRVGMLTLDVQGALLEGSPLLPSDDRHPFPGDVERRKDGAASWVVGFSDDQLSTCPPDRNLMTGTLIPAAQPHVRLPTPLWSAHGTWQGGTVELSDAEVAIDVTMDTLLQERTQCSVFDIEEHEAIIPAPGEFVSIESLDDRHALLAGDVSHSLQLIDADTMTTTLVETASGALYLGGTMDASGVIWLFGATGTLERMRIGGRPEVVQTDGPWAGAGRVWSASFGSDDSLTIALVDSLARGIYGRPGDWTVLFDHEPPFDLDHLRIADVHFEDREDVYFTHEGTFSLIRYEDGRVTAEEVNATQTTPSQVERTAQGLMVGTRSHSIYRKVARGQFVLVAEIDGGRQIHGLFGIGDATLYAYSNRLFVFVDGLPPCNGGFDSHNTTGRIVQVGDRVVTVGGEPGSGLALRRYDVRRAKIGCR